MTTDERERCLAYIEEQADGLPPYSGRLCGACGYDPYPAINEEVNEEFTICQPCKAKALAEVA